MICSCRNKEETSQISGRIIDPNQSIPVPDVRVEVMVKKIEGGTINSAYSTISTLYSGTDGGFSVSFDPVKAITYKLEFRKDGYFSSSDEFACENITIDYYETYNILPEAYLKIHIKNISPVNDSDQVSYQLHNGTINCSDCCFDSIYIFTGTDVDTIKYCKTYGHINIPVSWYVSKDTLTVYHSDTIFCPAFDTTLCEIFY